MTLDELIPLWEADCQKILPEFRLLRDDEMQRALDLARELMGDPKASNAQVCCTVIRNGEENDAGVPAAWWWITLATELMDFIIPTPWFELCWWLYETSRGKRKMHTLWGAASTGKTTFFVSVTITNLVVWAGGNARVMVTGPWQNSSEDKIWGGSSGIHTTCAAWVQENPDWLHDLGLKLDVTATEVSVLDDSGRPSTARFVALRSAASLQGIKRGVNRREDILKVDKKKGVILVLSDELIKNPEACTQLIEGEGNVVSNPNFMGFVAFNPIPHEVQHLAALPFSDPTERSRESLQMETDFSWRVQRGLLVRFCEFNSPNRHTPGDVIFPFLINDEQTEAQKERGEEVVAGQVKAWGFGESNNGSAMTHCDTKKPHLQDAPPNGWLTRPIRLLYADPAFGGNDPAIACGIEFGKTMVDGKPKNVLHVFTEQFRVPVSNTYVMTAQDWEDYQRLARVRGGKPSDVLTPMTRIESKHHMTLNLLRAVELHGIPTGHVSYDGSQRVDSHIPLVSALGRVPWYYEGSRKITDEEGLNWFHYPMETKEDGMMKMWSDAYNNNSLISMIWRFAERMIAKELVYGLKNCKRGTEEMLGRPWVTNAGGKLSVLSKDKLGKSPAYGETLATAIYFAVRYFNALPELFTETAQGGVPPTDSIFQFAPRRLDRSLWSA